MACLPEEGAVVHATALFVYHFILMLICNSFIDGNIGNQTYYNQHC